MLQYIFSLLLFIANTKALFQINSEIHSINTMYSSDFHRPFVILTTYKNETYYTYNMADVQGRRVSYSTVLASNPGNIVGNTCQCCDILKSELHKAKRT